MTKQSFSSKAVGLALLLAVLGLGACNESGGGGTVPTDCGARSCSKLTASDGMDQDVFGWSVAIDADVLVVGADGNDNLNGSGSAYVYRFDGAGWVEQAKLVASDGLAEDHFGAAVAVEGDVIVIGAYGVDNGSDVGSAYVYRFDGVNWVEEAKLEPSDGEPEDHFGTSVAIDGGVIVVGSPADDDNGSQSGSAYVYRYDGTDWIQERKLVGIPIFSKPEGFYGSAVAIDADVIAIGSYLDDAAGRVNSGSFWVYRYDGVNWVWEGKFLSPDPPANREHDFYGNALAVDGDVIAVAALLDDAVGLDSGSVHVYRHNGSSWLLEQSVVAADGMPNDRFGGSVDLDGTELVVGAGQNDDGSGPMSGSAYVFRYDGVSWVEEEKLSASDGAAGDDFGGSVAVDAGVIASGAIGDDDNGSDSGSVYVTE